MTYVLICKSCAETETCNLKYGFTDICPKINSKCVHQKLPKISRNCITAVYKDKINVLILKSKDEKEAEQAKRRILRDIEKGRGGPDIAGLNKIHPPYESRIINKAKERLTSSF